MAKKVKKQPKFIEITVRLPPYLYDYIVADAKSYNCTIQKALRDRIQSSVWQSDCISELERASSAELLKFSKKLNHHFDLLKNDQMAYDLIFKAATEAIPRAFKNHETNIKNDAAVREFTLDLLQKEKIETLKAALYPFAMRWVNNYPICSDDFRRASEAFPDAANIQVFQTDGISAETL